MIWERGVCAESFGAGAGKPASWPGWVSWRGLVVVRWQERVLDQ
jgi:hypothetical protein